MAPPATSLQREVNGSRESWLDFGRCVSHCKQKNRHFLVVPCMLWMGQHHLGGSSYARRLQAERTLAAAAATAVALSTNAARGQTSEATYTCRALSLIRLYAVCLAGIKLYMGL